MSRHVRSNIHIQTATSLWIAELASDRREDTMKNMYEDLYEDLRRIMNPPPVMSEMNGYGYCID